MRIGEIAERTGLNISNVRFYERKGLLTPERERGVNIGIIQKKMLIE